MSILSRIQKAIERLRCSSPGLDRFFCRVADVCTDLFGEGRSDLPTLQKALKTRISHIKLQERLLANVPADMLQSVFTVAEPTLQCPRLLNWAEMEAEPMVQAARELGLDPDDADRKIWEKSAVLHAIRAYGCLDSDSTGLGIGVGTESLPFYLSRHCKSVTGTDKYGSRTWKTARRAAEEVYDCATMAFDRESLDFMDADMRSLPFSDNRFDFVWSVSAIEHVSTIEEYLRALMEISRVLKPGGMAFLTTEWNLVPGNPVYAEGLIALDRVLYPWVLVNLEGIQQAAALNPGQPSHAKHVMATKFRDSLGRTTRPCINTLCRGSFLTPVLLIFRKQ